MKTEISRNSHEAEKRYSGVYQQQGRMITDADWNELTDIVKERLDDTLADVVGSGIPADEGIIRGGELCWGTAYVDGIRARLMPVSGNVSDAFAFDAQADLPLAFGSGPSNGQILFLDVWERVVTSYEDPALMDPALNGADTCSRTQTMAQLKWCAGAEQVSTVRDAPKARLSVERTTGYSGKATNFLFRLEVHCVSGSTLVLKWSRENGAERFYRLDADGTEQTPPEYFTLGNRVFEYFTPDSEKWLGFSGSVPAPEGSEPLNARDTQLNPNSPPSAMAYPHVRRWDGYCKVDFGSPSDAVLQDNLSGENLSVDGDSIMLSLEDLTLTISHANGPEGILLAGDYWQFELRDGGTLPVDAEPSGIRHHYLVLGSYSGSNNFITLASGREGAFSFPSLERAHDTFVNASGDTMSGPLSINSSLRVSNSVEVGGSMTITGDLTVNGNSTTVNVSDMQVEDNIVRVNKYPNRANPLIRNGGLEVFRGGNPSYPNAQLVWNETLDVWQMGVEGALSNVAYGPSWESLNNNSMADGKHRHSKLVAPNGSHDPAVVVDNIGNVGVGTAAPRNRLDIAGGQWNLTGTEGDLRVGNDTYRMKIGVATAGGGAGDVRIRAHGGTNRLILGGGTADVLTVGASGVVIGNGETSGGLLVVNGDLKITGSIVQPDWVPMDPLSSGWQAYGGGYNPPEYFLDRSGFVHLRGLIKLGTIGLVIFTLPLGFRPEHRELRCVMTNAGVGRCDVDATTGGVIAVNGGNGWFSLDGISFRAAVLSMAQWVQITQNIQNTINTTTNVTIQTQNARLLSNMMMKNVP